MSGDTLSPLERQNDLAAQIRIPAVQIQMKSGTNRQSKYQSVLACVHCGASTSNIRAPHSKTLVQVELLRTAAYKADRSMKG
jgi:hypothetical protein